MKMKKLALVSSRDSETVVATQRLMDQANRGEIIGFAYIALKPGGDYSGDIVGIARSTEILARGVVSTLWDQIPRIKK